MMGVSQDSVYHIHSVVQSHNYHLEHQSSNLQALILSMKPFEDTVLARCDRTGLMPKWPVLLPVRSLPALILPMSRITLGKKLMVHPS